MSKSRVSGPFTPNEEIDMTDTNNTPTPKDDDTDTGVKRPDQGGTRQLGQDPAKPATGGEGAAGAGGSDGFGTGA